jgi:hypothetical protein
MTQLTYKPIKGAVMHSEAVYCEGRRIGTIKRTHRGWEYFPKSKRSGGKPFPTLSECIHDVQFGSEEDVA